MFFLLRLSKRIYTSQLLSILWVFNPIIIIWMKGSYVLTLYDCVTIIIKIMKEKCEKINFVNKLSFILFGIWPAVVQYRYLFSLLYNRHQCVSIFDEMLIYNAFYVVIIIYWPWCVLFITCSHVIVSMGILRSFFYSSTFSSTYHNFPLKHLNSLLITNIGIQKTKFSLIIMFYIYIIHICFWI